MNKLVSALLIGSLALGGATLANADSDHHGKGEHSGKYCDKGKKHGSRYERMSAELGLSEAQSKQISDIRGKYQPQKMALREKMKANRTSLREVMDAQNVDQAAVKKLAEEQGKLKAEKIVLKSQMHAEMNKVLSKEQQEKMKKMRSEHGKGGKHHGHEEGHEGGRHRE